MGVNKKWLMAAGCVFLASRAIGGPTACQTTQGVRKELEAIQAQYIRAYHQNDRKALRRLYRETMTSDHTTRLLKGKVQTKEQDIADLDKGSMASVRFRDIAYKFLNLTVTGRQTVALVDCRASMDVPDAKGALHELYVGTISRDTWIKTPQGWKNKETVLLKAKTLVDGHPVRQ